jgi:type I restriction enzyme S subunit
LPELPEGWTWTSVDSLICSGPTNGISPKISENGLGGVPSFKLSATTRGEFLITNETIKNIDLEPDKAEKYWLSSGDLLVQRGNSIEYVGTAALFPGPDRTYVYPDLMMKIRPVQSVLGQWMTFCINSKYGRNYIQRKATGTAGSMPKINGDALRYLPIPLPSLDEIKKLTQVLASLQSYCSNHEKEAQLSLRRIDHLRQSILKSAFLGELVDQDLNDEPASELLVRIQEEQKQAKTSNPRSGRISKRSA